MNEFEKNIRKMLVDKGFSFGEFSRVIGVSEFGLRKMLSKGDCKISLIKEMCKVLGCTPNDIVI